MSLFLGASYRKQQQQRYAKLAHRARGQTKKKGRAEENKKTKRMHLSRPLIAACASCVARVITYPIDTLRVREMAPMAMETRNATLYDGLNVDLVGSAASTFTYFSVYESVPHTAVALRAVGAAAASALLYTAFDIRKKRIQARARARARVTPAVFWTAYALMLTKRLPKTCVHYLIYEALLPRLLVASSSNRLFAGGVSAAVGTAASTMLMYQMDVLRVRLIVGDQSSFRSRTVRALFFSCAHSVLGATIGHALLEHFAPRLGGA